MFFPDVTIQVLAVIKIIAVKIVTLTFEVRLVLNTCLTNAVLATEN